MPCTGRALASLTANAETGCIQATGAISDHGDLPEWDSTMDEMVDHAQADLGYFKNIKWPS